MAALTTGERRKYPRVAFSTTINIQIEIEENCVEVTGDSRDLSLKGVYIPDIGGYSIDTKCEVNIILSGSVENIQLRIRGRVARADKNGLGIVFDSMDVDSYSHLKNIVKYNYESHSL